MLQRKPFHLEELNQYEYGIAIRRDNETLTYITPQGCHDHPDDISSSSLLEDNLKSLNIVTNKLTFTIHHEGETFPTEPVLSFLRRLADWGYFVELKVRFTFDDDELEIDVPDCVVQEVIRTAPHWPTPSYKFLI